MYLSQSWIERALGAEVCTKALVNSLTKSGLEVEALTKTLPAIFEGVVVAEVQTVEPHPDADKLKVCAVDIGDSEPVQIVCGAPNVAPGVKVPCATLGAVLYGKNGDTFKIKRTKLRGVESLGMLCSASELGFDEAYLSDGLWLLPADAPVGQDLVTWLDLADNILDIAITPNRGDALSLRGLHREIRALIQSDRSMGMHPDECIIKNDVSVNAFSPEHIVKSLLDTPLKPLEAQNTKPADVTFSGDFSLDAGDAAPIYAGALIEIDADVMPDSPIWMQEYLRRHHLSCHGLLVDLTQFMMLIDGQPMHAFDATTLTGSVSVRYAKEGESVVLLDESEIELSEKDLVVADEKAPQALAGVMGGMASRVTESTRHVWLEAAHFNPTAVQIMARKHGVQSDAAYRFERGVDTAMPEQTLRFACQLLQSILNSAGAKLTLHEFKSVAPEHPQKVATLTKQQITKKLGIDCELDLIKELFEALDIGVTTINDSDANRAELSLELPSARFDLSGTHDLVEEVSRMIGLDQIPVIPPVLTAKPTVPDAEPIITQVLSDTLVSRGFSEVINYSFVSNKLQALLFPDKKAVALQNPLTADMDVMRLSLWSGLLKSAAYNLKRQYKSLSLFEVGAIFNEQSVTELSSESSSVAVEIAGLRAGHVNALEWQSGTENVSFYDLKQDVTVMLDRVLSSASEPLKSIKFEVSDHDALHPGQQADILFGDMVIGQIGALHPSLFKKLGLPAKTPVFLFKVRLDLLETHTKIKMNPIAKYPSVRRDLALELDVSTHYAALEAEITKAASDRLQSVTPFDVYSGEHIDAGKKSVAVALQFIDPDKTLEDSDIELEVEKILSHLTQSIGATLRQ